MRIDENGNWRVFFASFLTDMNVDFFHLKSLSDMTVSGCWKRKSLSITEALSEGLIAWFKVKSYERVWTIAINCEIRLQISMSWDRFLSNDFQLIRMAYSNASIKLHVFLIHPH